MHYLPYALIGDLLILDQLTKWLATKYWQDGIQVFDFFALQYAENTGVAFSFPVPLPVVVFVSIFMVGMFLFEMKQDRHRWAYACLTAGALGNLIDRLWHGYVIDFLSFGSFPIFNVADVCISVGVGLLLFDVLKQKKLP